MTSFPFVLVTLFALTDGTTVTMETSERFRSPLKCGIQALILSENAKGRTYVCMTRQAAQSFFVNSGGGSAFGPKGTLSKASRRQGRLD